MSIKNIIYRTTIGYIKRPPTKFNSGFDINKHLNEINKGGKKNEPKK